MGRGLMTPRLLPYSPERDVYRLLGVPSSASIDEILAACRRLARTFHPDLNESGRATEEMQVVNVVRQVMSDPESRATYDRERYRFHAAMSQPSDPMLHAWPPIATGPARPRTLVGRYLARRGGRGAGHGGQSHTEALSQLPGGRAARRRLLHRLRHPAAAGEQDQPQIVTRVRRGAG